MPKQPLNSAFDKDAYLERLAASKSQMRATLLQLLEWVDRLDVHAASSFTAIEPLVDLFPTHCRSQYFRIGYDIHTSAKRYGALGVSIKSSSMRGDLSRMSPAEIAHLLKRFCAADEARAHTKTFSQFNRFLERVAALRFLDVDFVPLGQGGAVLPRWFESIEQYGKNCRPALEASVNRFLDLTSQLDQAMFDFNAAMGPVRFRAIRCSYTIDDFELLGPSNPEIKVVTYTHPLTKQRRYSSVRDFKADLRRRRVRKALTAALGRPPEPMELQAGLEKERNKKPGPYITKEVIKACYMGRHAKIILEAQDNLVAVMQPWAVLRAQLQALL